MFVRAPMARRGEPSVTDGTTPATQALLPVTVEDREAAARVTDTLGDYLFAGKKIRAGESDEHWLVQAFARHRQAHSLPGDVGMLQGLCDKWVSNLEYLNGLKEREDLTEFGEGRLSYAIEIVDDLRAALTPSALSGDAGEVEPSPGCYADLQQRRVTTLAKLGLMLSVMASGDAPEVVGYDAAEIYAEVLMALAIEDAEDTDIALEIVRDHPEADILAGHRISCPPVTEEAEKVAAWLEQYPSPMNDLDMAMRIRQICARIRAGAHRKSDATPSGEAGEG